MLISKAMQNFRFLNVTEAYQGAKTSFYRIYLRQLFYRYFDKILGNLYVTNEFLQIQIEIYFHQS